MSPIHLIIVQLKIVSHQTLFQLFRENGRRMGKLINRLRCLYTLQDAALKKDSLSSDLLFISSTDLDAMLRYVDEIVSIREGIDLIIFKELSQ